MWFTVNNGAIHVKASIAVETSSYRFYGDAVKKSRRESHRSNLRGVRDATEMSQDKFAARLGTSKSNIENYEIGRAKLPEKIALRIAALTGVIPQTLYDERAEAPISFNGEPFSKGTFEKWKAVTYNKEDAGTLITVARNFLDILLTSALGPTVGKATPHIFRELLLDFNQFLETRAERLQLLPTIEALVRDRRAAVDQKETTVGALRARFKDDPEWSSNDVASWNDSQKATINGKVFPLFQPFMTFGEKDGKPVFVSLSLANREVLTITVETKQFHIIFDHHHAKYLEGGDVKTALPDAVETPASASPKSSHKALNQSRRGGVSRKNV